MQRVSAPTLTFVARAYWLLAKPGIVLGNAITASAGFVLASKGSIDFRLLLATLIGLSLLMASGCVCNNYIDRAADAKMARTKNRALAQERISSRHALIFAIVLSVLSILVFALYTPILSFVIALLGFVIYVWVYSFAKYHSVHATLIGSIAGAVPPVVGYCAVSKCVDTGALILFFILVFWQMPHFYAIAMYRLKDYAAASIPVLPIKKGTRATKIQMLLYIIAFIGASSLLAFFDYVGYGYLIATFSLGLAWLCLCIKGWLCQSDTRWAREMFIFSLVVVMGLCISIALNWV